MRKRKGGNFRGKRVVSGDKIGARSIRVYLCNTCDVQQPIGAKPECCKYCGGLSFTTFDSLGEASRWATLVMLEKGGKLSNLRRQVPFDLMAARSLNGATVASKVGQYIADFVYERDGKEVIEDYKGAAIDPLAAWKLRHMEAMGKPVKISQQGA